jgi:ribosomal protein S18 acetylase RimI-like enzyme
MALAFIQIVPLLGYKASMFNLVFENNTPSIRLWRSLGFKEIGRVPNAGYLIKNKQITDQTNAEVEEEYVDAIMFYYSFT